MRRMNSRSGEQTKRNIDGHCGGVLTMASRGIGRGFVAFCAGVSRCYTISSQQLPTVATSLHPARSDVRPRPNQLAQARVAARGGEEERGGEDGAFPFGGGRGGIGGAAFRGTRVCACWSETMGRTRWKQR
jgi:hypothetical protein